MPSDSPQPIPRQTGIDSFGNSPEIRTAFEEPPIPEGQDDLELLNPVDTLDTLRNPTSDIRTWLSYIRHAYQPPSEALDVLLLYPCAAEKPMPESKTYTALSKTLSQFTPAEQRRIHVVTVSEPMGLIPYEFQDGSTWLYDNPGLFEWWCRENDRDWNDAAQEKCLQILGDHISGFLRRAFEREWYSSHIACVRHVTCDGNLSTDQTHRRMLERAENRTGDDLEWLPQRQTVLDLTVESGRMAWQMAGVSHDRIQIQLKEHLSDALEGDE